jgi:hypothetical protein
MNPEVDNDSLLLIYEYDTDRPLGTGFFVSNAGHFVTAYHIIREYIPIKERLRCKWKGKKDYGIRHEGARALYPFYQSLKKGMGNNDLILLRLDITNESVKTKPVYATSFDFNKETFAGLDATFKGFRTEEMKKTEDALMLYHKVKLLNYSEANGVWLFHDDQNIWKGFSGSPVLNPKTGEVMGVVVQRTMRDEKVGAMQSLHMLVNKLKQYGYDCDSLFAHSRLHTEYHKRLKCRFTREDWPYAVDKKMFVGAFGFDTYRFGHKTDKDTITNKNCIPFIVRRVRQQPVFCLGYYGMGKTTISKFLFVNYSKYSKGEYVVYVNLGDLSLFELSPDNFTDEVARKMCKDFVEGCTKGQNARTDAGFVREYFKEFLKNKRVVLILDGVDEAISNKQSLIKFAELLKSLRWTYLLTSRSEFYAFIDAIKDPMRDRSHLVIELRPWGWQQWDRYIENLYRKIPEKAPLVKRLKSRLGDRMYGNLPERPLFLKMICDIELDNETNLEIPPELRSNRAQIYHVYIKWKIRDDYKRKRGKEFWKSDEEQFVKECFELFRRLAHIEYEKSLPKGGAAGFFAKDDDPRAMYEYSGFTKPDIESVCRDMSVLTLRLLIDSLFGESTFFSTIRREKKEKGHDLFRFSHKSFCEYLAAFNLADSIFGRRVEDAECGPSWNLYQTHEVSTHFQDEVIRVCYYDKIPEQTKKGYLQTAFEKVLSGRSDFQDYLERVEQVLYYTGKFELNSPTILEVLQKITEDPSRVNPVYYRTAHLSLGMVLSLDYCMKYIEYLIDSYRKDKEAFLWNTKIQIGYYGRTDLQSLLRGDIDTFIKDAESHKGTVLRKGIIPLEIFSYFTCLPFDVTEMDNARSYLDKITQACDARHQLRMKRILNETRAILEENVREPDNMI